MQLVMLKASSISDKDATNNTRPFQSDDTAITLLRLCLQHDNVSLGPAFFKSLKTCLVQMVVGLVSKLSDTEI